MNPDNFKYNPPSNADSNQSAHQDYSNNRVLNMVRDSGLNLLELDEQVTMKKERNDLFKLNQKKLFEESQRKWLKNKDKEQFIDFNDDYRKKMKNYFSSQDVDGGGSIGLDEMEDPLITLGISKDKDGVKAQMDAIDQDGSGQIEFSEFQQIIKGKSNIFGKGEHNTNTNTNAKIVEFFKGKLFFVTKKARYG